jgi:SWI/SNF-related matrix-associated actin-dependent regulator of chromatin subfamily A containing DEAD/H box 1
VVKLITRGTIEEDMLKLGETKLALDEAVAGDNDETNEGGEDVYEKEMKTSLMNVLRKQFASRHENCVGLEDEGEGASSASMSSC